MNGAVQSNKSKCVVKEGEVILELTKEEPGLWPHLSEIVDQKKLVEVKKEIIEEGRKIAAEEKECKESLYFNTFILHIYLKIVPIKW